MKTTRQIEREARRLLRFCLAADGVDESRVRLMTGKILASKHRGYVLLLGRFLRLLKHEYAQRTAEIESAVPLTADLQAQVRDGLSAVYGPRLTWSFLHNPDLIGGMRVKIGSDVYDGSVRSGINALARSFGLTGTNGKRLER